MTRSLELLARACAPLLAVVLAIRPVANFDVGYHIRAGELLMQGPWPEVDPFSFTSTPWVLEQWLGSITYFLLHDTFGVAGVIVGKALLVGVVFAVTVFAATRAGDNFPAALVATLLAVTVAFVRFKARPFIFSFVCLSVLIAALITMRQRNIPPRSFLLVALFAVWPHFHPEYFTGLAVLAAFGAGAVAEVWLAPRTDRIEACIDRAGLMRLIALGAACGVAVVVSLAAFHPTGLASFHRTLELAGSDFFRMHTNEVRPLWTNYGLQPQTVVLLGLPPLLWIGLRRRLPLPLMAVHALLGATALMHGRMVAAASIAAAPAWAQAVDTLGVWVQDRRAGAASAGGPQRSYRTPVLAACVAVTLALVSLSVSRGFGYRLQWHENFQPTGCYSLIDKHDPQGRVFNDMYFGSSFIFHFYPRRQTFVDGRSTYSEKFFLEEYYPIAAAQPGWDEKVDAWGVDWFLLYPGRHVRLQAALHAHTGWNFIYRGDNCVIFTRRTSEPAS